MNTKLEAVKAILESNLRVAEEEAARYEDALIAALDSAKNAVERGYGISGSMWGISHDNERYVAALDKAREIKKTLDMLNKVEA